MIALQGSVGEVALTLQITRKETGQVEEVQVTGFIDEQQRDALIEAGLIQQES